MMRHNQPPTEQQPALKPFFKTTDLQISTILVLSGFSLHGIEKTGVKASFVFRPDDEIAVTIGKFFSGVLLFDPQKIFEVWKGLRSMAYRTVE